MISREEFLGKLAGLVGLARENGGRIDTDTVKDYFASDDLTDEQTDLVYDYLMAQKISVVGYLKTARDDAVPDFTKEEEEYLRRCLEHIEDKPALTPGELEALYTEAAKGAEASMSALAEAYLREVVETAKEFRRAHGGVFIGDLIQEGTLGLMSAIRSLGGADDPEGDGAPRAAGEAHKAAAGTDDDCKNSSRTGNADAPRTADEEQTSADETDDDGTNVMRAADDIHKAVAGTGFDYHAMLLEFIRESMQLFIEEQREVTGRDLKMIEKVREVDEAINDLTRELGRGITADELAERLNMDIEDLEDILRLTGEFSHDDE